MNTPSVFILVDGNFEMCASFELLEFTKCDETMVIHHNQTTIMVPLENLFALMQSGSAREQI